MKGENPDKFRVYAFSFPYRSAIFTQNGKTGFTNQILRPLNCFRNNRIKTPQITEKTCLEF